MRCSSTALLDKREVLTENLYAGEDFFLLCPLFQILFFSDGNQTVKKDSNHTENKNSKNHGGQLEDLTGINNQVSKSFFAADHFTDHDTDQTQTDIHFHNTERKGNRGRQDYLKKCIFSGSF